MPLKPEQRQEIEGILDSLAQSIAADIAAAKAKSQPVTLDQQSVGRVSRVDN